MSARINYVKVITTWYRMDYLWSGMLPFGRRLGYPGCWVTQPSMKRHTFHNFEIYVVKLFVFMLVYGFVLGFIVYLLFTYVTMRQEQGWWVTQC